MRDYMCYYVYGFSPAEEAGYEVMRVMWLREADARIKAARATMLRAKEKELEERLPRPPANSPGYESWLDEYREERRLTTSTLLRLLDRIKGPTEYYSVPADKYYTGQILFYAPEDGKLLKKKPSSRKGITLE